MATLQQIIGASDRFMAGPSLCFLARLTASRENRFNSTCPSTAVQISKVFIRLRDELALFHAAAVLVTLDVDFDVDLGVDFDVDLYDPETPTEAPPELTHSRDADLPDLDSRSLILMTWRHRATCVGEDPELFFPIGNTGPALLQIEKAKAVCRRCEVVATCLTWAIESGQDAGVCGGLSDEERDALKRRIARALLLSRVVGVQGRHRDPRSEGRRLRLGPGLP